MQNAGQMDGQTLSQTLSEALPPLVGDTGWHDALLGGSWSDAVWDDDDDAQRTIAEIDALLGELIAELEG